MIVADKFVLIRPIAEGGAGIVYEAEDQLVRRRVALKMLHPQWSRRREYVTRFRREAEAAARVQHPNVVKILEMGLHKDSTFYIVQELLEGSNVRTLLERRVRLAQDEVVDLVAPIASALAAAHASGVVHRDVKPENIVLASTRSGEIVPMLIDFGVARMNDPRPGRSQAASVTRVGSILGTLEYMSPEQAVGELSVGPATDVWAVGVLLFELVAGACPFTASAPTEIVGKILTTQAPRLDSVVASASAALADIVAAALRREPSARPTARQLREMLLSLPRASRSTVVIDAGLVPSRGRRRSGTEIVADFEDEIAATFGSTGEREPTQGLFSEDLEDEQDTTDGFDTAGAIRKVGLEWEQSVVLGTVDELLVGAQEALGINALDEAWAYAEQAITLAARKSDVTDDTFGRLRLIGAIVCWWRGDYALGERLVREAEGSLRTHTTGCLAAIGHQAMLSAALGNRDEVVEAYERLTRSPTTEGLADVVALCRLGVCLRRVGRPEMARAIAAKPCLRRAEDAPEAFVRGWTQVLAAELSDHDGNPMQTLRHCERAAEEFTAAGDIRNACLQRLNIGNGYLQLGAFGRAARVLEEVICVSAPLRLAFVSSARADLSLALARLGRADEALPLVTEALAHFRQQGSRRWEVVACIYKSTVLAVQGDLDAAMGAASEAVSAADPQTPIRAHALASLAGCCLIQNQVARGLEVAAEAMDILETQHGAEDGEALIRVVFASALLRAGRRADATRAIESARVRLEERAARIHDPRYRASFLEAVPENARTLRLAETLGVVE